MPFHTRHVSLDKAATTDHSPPQSTDHSCPLVHTLIDCMARSAENHPPDASGADDVQDRNQDENKGEDGMAPCPNNHVTKRCTKIHEARVVPHTASCELAPMLPHTPPILLICYPL